MKFKSVLLVLITLMFSYSCSDMLDDDNRPVDPDLITPDLTVKVTTSVSGFVIDETGEPIVYANVSTGNKEVQTDEYGYFNIANVAVPEFAGQVKIVKTGYFEGYKTFHSQEGKEAFVRVQLLEKIEAETIDASTGGTATLENVSVTLPTNAVIVNSTQQPYAGTVHVHIRSISSSGNNFQLDKPGDARGTNEDGHVKALQSFSSIAVELTGGSGEALQLAAGKSATVSLPIPTTLLADAPAEIALWSLNETTGLWQQESTATKIGNAYVGSVNHFSFWDGAEGIPMVNFTARIVNSSGQPLVHVPVSVTPAGMPKNAGHGRFGYTDANGYVTGSVFANKNLVLDILTPCALSAYEHAFSTSNVDIDLGTLTGNLGQSVVTLSGTVVNCEDQPVVSGYVQTYDNGFYNRIAIVNGVFTFSGLSCTNTEVNFVAVNNATHEQNQPQSVTIVAGANNLGTLTACGTSTMGFITYTIDGTTVSITEPTDTLAAYLATPGEVWTQVVTLSGDPNMAQQFSFQFNGGKEISANHKLTDVFSNAFPSNRGYWPVPITLTITEYGNVGGFISGSFSSTMLDFESNEDFAFSCSFRVRRRN